MALDPRFGRPDGVKMALYFKGATLTGRRHRIEIIRTQLVDHQIALKIWEALFYHDPHCRPSWERKLRRTPKLQAAKYSFKAIQDERLKCKIKPNVDFRF